MNPSECVVDVLAEVKEKHDATSKSLTSHYERSSDWLTEAIQTCKRKILEGTGHEVAEPKRMKKTASADKENSAVSNVKSVLQVEKKARKLVPASIKKAKKDVPPGYNHVMSLKVMALREELRQRKLDTTGLKKDLQKRLLKAIEEEVSKKRENKSVIKSAAKAKKPPPIADDEDGDVQMKDTEASSNEIRRDSSKMDIDEDATRRMNDASAVKASAKKGAKETTVGKSFLKKTAELFSPSKSTSKMHSSKKEEVTLNASSVVVKDAGKKQEAPQSGRKPLKDGLKKTASAILSASPGQKAPFSKGSAVKAKTTVTTQEVPPKEASAESHALKQSTSSTKSSSETKNDSLSAAAAPTIPNKLGTVDKNAGAATKSKRDKAAAERAKRLAEIRGKSKPVEGVSKSGATSDLPVLSSSKTLKLGVAKAKDGKPERKILLNAQMREKAGLKAPTLAAASAPLSSKLNSTSQKPSELATSVAKAPPTSNTTTTTTVAASAQSQSQSAPKITASPSLVKQMKQVASLSTAKSAKASSSKKKKKSAAPRQDVLSPMSTYEMSDREQSDTDDSESESHHHRKKKKVPTWAQKQNLLPALEAQYANRDGRLDPETIFPPVTTCSLEDIFDQKKSRFKQRTSSANWAKDGVSHTEIVAYKRTMGY